MGMSGLVERELSYVILAGALVVKRGSYNKQLSVEDLIFMQDIVRSLKGMEG